MENLIKLISLNEEEIQYMVGFLVGYGDSNPNRPVGEVINEAFGDIDKLRRGEIDPVGDLFKGL